MPKKKSLVAGEEFSRLSLPDQVRLARPLASQLLIEGINFCERHTSNSTIDRICELAGVPHPVSLIEKKLNEDEVLFAVEATLNAALALGLALGQSLTPNALLYSWPKSGGAQ